MRIKGLQLTTDSWAFLNSVFWGEVRQALA